jgi:hypothetical protein
MRHNLRFPVRAFMRIASLSASAFLPPTHPSWRRRSPRLRFPTAERHLVVAPYAVNPAVVAIFRGFPASSLLEPSPTAYDLHEMPLDLALETLQL